MPSNRILVLPSTSSHFREGCILYTTKWFYFYFFFVYPDYFSNYLPLNCISRRKTWKTFPLFYFAFAFKLVGDSERLHREKLSRTTSSRLSDSRFLNLFGFVVIKCRILWITWLCLALPCFLLIFIMVLLLK